MPRPGTDVSNLTTVLSIDDGCSSETPLRAPNPEADVVVPSPFRTEGANQTTYRGVLVFWMSWTSGDFERRSFNMIMKDM